VKILICGGSGFIGTNIATKALSNGHKVVAFDNLKRRGVETNILQHENYQFIHGDVRCKEDFEFLPDDIDGIINLAANPGIPWSITNPMYDFQSNCVGALNVLEYAKNHGKIPVVFASTNKVYSEAVNKIEVTEYVPFDKKTGKFRREDATRYVYKDEFWKNGIPEQFHMDGQGKFPHSPYGCCYDDKTEILTIRGWKLFKDIKKDEIVATINKDRQNLEFQKITNKYTYNYKGKMFHQTNRRMDLMVTPNHKLFISWHRTNKRLINPKLVTAEDAFGKCYSHVAGADYIGGIDNCLFILPKTHYNFLTNKKFIKNDRKIEIKNWLKFLGWYLSEGNIYKTKQGNYNVILSTYSRFSEAKKVFEDIGYKNIQMSGHHVLVSDKQLFDYLKQFGKAKDKFIPHKIKQLKSELLQVLLDNLLNGDGNKNSKNTYRYTTISKQLADDFQEIAIKCGYSANIVIDKEKFYRVYISTSRTIQCNLIENRSQWIDYSGKIYCVSVPNEVVMIRRNGKSIFCGNSKASADLYHQEYYHAFGVPTVVNRMSCIYGKYQFGVADQGWVAWFMIAKVLSKPLTIYGNGLQVRDALYAEDVAELYLMELENIDKFKGQVFNVGGGPANTVSLKEAIELIEILDHGEHPKLKINYTDWRLADHRVYISDITKVSKYWKPKTNVFYGFYKTFNWVKDNKDILEKFI